MDRRRPWLRLAGVSLCLSVLTFAAMVFVQTYLFDHAWVGTILDDIAMPGAFMASFVFPEGIHSDSRAAGWAWAPLIVAGNLLTYWGLWALFVWTTRRVFGHGRGEERLL